MFRSHNLRLFDQSCVQVVNVLGYEHRLHIRVLKAVLLELCDSVVTLVNLLVFRQLDEVIVPLPYSHRVFLEEGTC